MKFAAVAALVACGQAFVLPDLPDLPKPRTARPSRYLHDLASSIGSRMFEAGEHALDDLDQAINAAAILGDDVETQHPHRHHHHDLSNYTIYELISTSNYTKRFGALVDKHKDVVDLLNSTAKNYTLFVPVDKAFEHLPPHHEPPPDDFIEGLLKYHAAAGSFTARDVILTRTLPSVYEEKFLGGKPQRLRTSVGFGGVRINAYSKVIAVNIKAKNGYIHTVDKILVQPTWIGALLNYFPQEFSTLSLAYTKTGFGKFLHSLNTVGSTVFAPGNAAWAKLGPHANAFLFNTDKGKKYLRALLKYQIVANTTLYSNEVYYGDEAAAAAAAAAAGGKSGGAHAKGSFHIELHTLLGGKSLGVDIHDLHGWTNIIVNGVTSVSFLDGLAKNGVVQAVKDVPIPPHKQPRAEESADGELTVEDLMERLEEYLEDEAEAGVEDEEEFKIQDQGWTNEL